MKKLNLEKIERLAQKNKLNTKQKALVTGHLLNPKQSGYKLAIASGYTPSTSRTNPLTHPKVKQTLLEYLRGGNLDAKIQRHYDEAMEITTEDAANMQEKLAIVSAKNAVVKELHKIAGHYAPVKSLSATITTKIPSMDDE